MDYDNDLAFAVERYREMQKALPGADALYRLSQAQFELSLPAHAHILIVGAGGGREIETLGESEKTFTLTGVDPSQDMLHIAKHYRSLGTASDRTSLLHGTVNDVNAPEGGFDAATSLLVMHFLPDNDGPDGKLCYLRAIRERIKTGAPFMLADVSYDSDAEFDAMQPMFLTHAELAGLDRNLVVEAPGMIKTMPTISSARTAELLLEAGFREPQLLFQTLWYRGWSTTAA